MSAPSQRTHELVRRFGVSHGLSGQKSCLAPKRRTGCTLSKPLTTQITSVDRCNVASRTEPARETLYSQAACTLFHSAETGSRPIWTILDVLACAVQNNSRKDSRCYVETQSHLHSSARQLSPVSRWLAVNNEEHVEGGTAVSRQTRRRAIQALSTLNRGFNRRQQTQSTRMPHRPMRRP